MKNEEKYIRSKMEEKNPFSVPNGYFEGLTQRVMSTLPSNENTVFAKRRMRLSIAKSVIYVAACICIAILGASIYLVKIGGSNDIYSGEEDYSYIEDTYEDNILDYAMLDNVAIYAYLADE